jgi:thiosulfate/3-mercaptopyruvate sulfurtransferase
MTPPVVSRQWLAEHRDGVVLADVRRDVPGLPAGDAFERGHLAGAVFVDLDRWLAGPPDQGNGRHPLPTPEHFAEGLAAAGAGEGDTVVAYDDADGVLAARLVWMLRATGRDAALLDGSLRASEPLLERGAATPLPRRSPLVPLRPTPWPAAQLADLDDATDSSNVVLDARPRPRYLGTVHDPLDPQPGHIPGARSLPCRDNLDPQGLLLPVDVLRQRLADAGVTDAASVVSSCGSGVTACHTLLLLEHVGLGRGRLYPGSWSEYASDPARPVARGEG